MGFILLQYLYDSVFYCMCLETNTFQKYENFRSVLKLIKIIVPVMPIYLLKSIYPFSYFYFIYSSKLSDQRLL